MRHNLVKRHLACALIACALAIGCEIQAAHAGPISRSIAMEQQQDERDLCRTGWLYGGGWFWWMNGWWSGIQRALTEARWGN